MSTATMGRTQVLPNTKIDPATGEPRLAHIVGPKDKTEGAVLVMEGRINGSPVKALCGKILVPAHDPNGLSNCKRCEEVFKDQTGGAEDGWKDA